MPPHDNRNRKNLPGVPLPVDIKAARERYGLTQTQAAAVVHSVVRVWQQWEAGERRMHPAFWELFILKASARAVPAPRGGT